MLQLAGIALRARSIGGLETCIQLPGWDLAFDIGRCPHAAVHRSTVAFTHAHMDHMGGVAFHAATRSLRGLPPPRYVVPPENAAAFRDLFAVWRRLDRSRLDHEMVVLGPGDALALREGLELRPFRSVHRVPTQGYGVWSRRRRLLPAYQGLPGHRIRDLRRQGVEVTREVWACDLAFTGDTRIEVVEREEAVRTARVLVIEVTFVDDRVSVEACRAKGHVHLDEFVARADLFQNEAILLTHFSARYTAQEIRTALDRRLPPSLRERVVPLLDGHRGRLRAG